MDNFAVKIWNMFELSKLFERAQKSSFQLRLLNWALGRVVPFNRPHHFKVVAISKHRLRVRIPYKRSNLNHIKGLHACALATLSEFTTGLLLLANLEQSKYRLIMQRLEMEYHYQGKISAWAEFELSDEWLSQKILAPLSISDAVVVPCEIRSFDDNGNHLATGKVFWQIKSWSKVRTKVDA